MNKELKNILVVEDEPDIQTIVKLSLESLGGYNVQTCNSGIESLSLLSSGYLPNLILMDVMMPQMDGPTTFLELQKKDTLKHIPVIFMTAKAQVAEIQGYRELGVLDIIVKPFDPIMLAQLIKEIWEKTHV